MKNIHICLVSDQPIPNLTSALQFKPDTVILLYTVDRKSQKERLERVLKQHRFQVEGRQIEAYGLGNVVDTCEAIINHFSGCELSLNITGGTKIGALGAFQPFYTANLPIYYVNTRDDEILRISPTETSTPITITIGIREYLECYGFKVNDLCKDFSGMLRRREVTLALRDLAIMSEHLIGKLNGSFPPDHERCAYPLETAPLDAEVLTLSPLFEKHRIARSGNKGGLLVNSVEHATYLRGGWFEELAAMAAKEAGADEVAMNVIGEWDLPGKKLPANEFDVMLTKGNRLFLISCKTRYNYRQDGNEGIAKEFLYELDSLGDQALGIFGGKMLANARTIKGEYVRKRAQAMKIRVVDKNDIANLKGKIQEWLKR